MKYYSDKQQYSLTHFSYLMPRLTKTPQAIDNRERKRDAEHQHRLTCFSYLSPRQLREKATVVTLYTVAQTVTMANS